MSDSREIPSNDFSAPNADCHWSARKEAAAKIQEVDVYYQDDIIRCAGDWLATLC